jgi:hypothetical protein
MGKPLPLKTKVIFDIADLDKGEGVITAARGGFCNGIGARH